MNQKPRSQGFIIPIVRSSQLWLAPFDGDGRRFASAFKETWKLIPISDRKTMNRRWARQREQFHDHATPIPQIELMRSKSDWGRGPSGNALAQFIPVPFDTLSFCSTAADVMPGALLYAFIAHELAHVYLLAINHESHAPDIGDSWKEQAVYDLLTERWGFDDMACDEWIAGHLQEQEQENEHNGKLGPPPPSK